MAKAKKADKPVAIRDRIREFRRVPARSLKPHPQNWRRHPDSQRAALAGVLEEIGYAGAILTRELDDGSLQIIDGHLRAETTPDMDVPVLVLDVDEREANYLLATLDPVGDMAEADQAVLGALIKKTPKQKDCVAEMLRNLTSAAGLIDPPETPESVQQNIEHISKMKKAHRQIDANAEKKGDTERYLVIVFPNREEREKANAALGLPPDERYIASGQITITSKNPFHGKVRVSKFSDGKKRRAANAKHSDGG